MIPPEEIYSQLESIWQSLPYWKDGGPLRRIKLEDVICSLSQDERLYLDWWLDRHIKRMELNPERNRIKLHSARAIMTINSEIATD